MLVPLRSHIWSEGIREKLVIDTTRCESNFLTTADLNQLSWFYDLASPLECVECPTAGIMTFGARFVCHLL